MIEGLLGFAAMFALMALRVPIAVAMGIVGFVGFAFMRSWPAAMSSAAGEFTDVGAYTLSVVPLFVLMGNFVTRAGMSRDLYQAAYAFIGHRRGGLALSTIPPCAGFGAVPYTHLTPPTNRAGEVSLVARPIKQLSLRHTYALLLYSVSLPIT